MFNKNKDTLDKILNHLDSIKPDNDEEIIKYVEEYVTKFDRKGDENENIYYFFSFAILAVSALTPFLNSLIPPDATVGGLYNVSLVKFYTSILAVISAVSVGTLQIIQAFDKMNLEKVTRIHLEREIFLYKTIGGVYSTEINPSLLKGDPSSLASRRSSLFAQRAAEIIVNKFDRYYSISSNTRQSPDRDKTEKT